MTLETNDVIYEIRDGILFCSYKKELVMDIITAERIVKDRLEFTQGKDYPILIDFSNMKTITKEARDYMNSPQGGLRGLIGGAFLGNNAVATLFINLYLALNNPPIPARFFTNKEDALEWLKKIRNEYGP